MIPQKVAPNQNYGRKEELRERVIPTVERQARLSKNKTKISHRIGSVDPIRREEWILQWRKGVQATILLSWAPKY